MSNDAGFSCQDFERTMEIQALKKERDALQAQFGFRTTQFNLELQKTAYLDAQVAALTAERDVAIEKLQHVQSFYPLEEAKSADRIAALEADKRRLEADLKTADFELGTTLARKDAQIASLNETIADLEQQIKDWAIS